MVIIYQIIAKAFKINSMNTLSSQFDNCKIMLLIPKPMYLRDWSACHQRLKFYGHSKIHCDNHNLFVFMSDI